MAGWRMAGAAGAERIMGAAGRAIGAGAARIAGAGALRCTGAGAPPPPPLSPRMPWASTADGSASAIASDDAATRNTTWNIANSSTPPLKRPFVRSTRQGGESFDPLRTGALLRIDLCAPHASC